MDEEREAITQGEGESEEALTLYTEGDVTKQMLDFAWPILLSSIFHEFYNLTNSLIVGNFIDVHALSVVSACTWICNVFSYMFYGLGMGGGILIANYAGSGDRKNLKEALDTSLIFAVGGGILLTIASELALPLLMDVSNISADLYADSLGYLRVYLIGNTAVLTYQMCFFIMRSFGDSRHPLYYLILSSITNLVLGVIFVRVLNLSVVGTALATIISQYIVDILSLRLLFRLPGLAFDVSNIEFSWHKVVRICSLGIPAGIQNMLVAISGMMVQSFVNTFPNETISGIGVAERILNWGQHPSGAMGNATMMMVGQNVGAKKYDRAQESISVGIRFAVLGTALYVAVIMVFAPTLAGFFNDNLEVRAVATEMIRWAMPSYIGICFSHVYNAACRACGNVAVPLVIAVSSQAVIRYLTAYLGLMLTGGDAHALYLAGATGFVAAGTFAFLYFSFSSWSKKTGLR